MKKSKSRVSTLFQEGFPGYFCTKRFEPAKTPRKMKTIAPDQLRQRVKDLENEKKRLEKALQEQKKQNPKAEESSRDSSHDYVVPWQF